MKNKKLTLVIIILLIWNVVLTILLINNKSITQTITEENVYDISTDLTKVTEECYSSVVGIKTTYGNQTGFIYKQEDNKTYIVTVYHGIGNDNTVSVVLANNKSVPATVVGFDYLRDVAILSIDNSYILNTVKCGDNEYTKNGEFVICIGSSDIQTSTNDVKLGIVSNKLVGINDIITYQRNNYEIQKEMIALSLDVSEGYSGSPIFNIKKEVIGMIQMSDEEKTYSLTINELKIIADEIINNETVYKIDLGINGKYIKNMEDYERNILNISFDVTNGYYVNDVKKNSLAGKIEILPNDIILSINNVQINGQKDLLNSLYAKKEQDLTIKVYRADKVIELKGNIDD